MGRFGRHPSRITEFFARAGTSVLALSIALQPLSAHAVTTTNTGTGTSTTTSAWTVPAPAVNNQSGAQQNAGNKNSLASTLGTAIGVVSMAAGGLFMAKGVKDLSCCNQTDCAKPDATAAVGEHGAIVGASNSAAGVVVTPIPEPVAPVGVPLDPAPVPNHRQPVDYWHLRFPSGADNNCPATRARNPFLLFDLFQPPTVHAAGCLEATITLAMGGLMLLQGIMGLAGAKKAGDNANTAFGNAGGMASYPGDLGGTAVTGSHGNDGSTASKLGAGGDAGSVIKLDPALLRTGTANDIMGQFEHKFGIGRDSFAQNVMSGEDPRKILATAPVNPLGVGDMNKAVLAAQNMTDDQKREAMARSPMAGMQAEMQAKMDGGGAGTGGGGRSPAGGLFGKDKEELAPIAAAAPNPAPALVDPGLSPEVQAALLAKQEAESHLDVNLMTLFQRVHAKYHEKTGSIFGFEPTKNVKGIGNADGD